jgi:TonB family protein
MAAALLWVLSGCASTGTAVDACRSELARDPRSLGDVVDSVRLDAAIETLWPPASGLVLAEIVYDSTGARDTVTVLANTLSDGTRTRLENEVGSAAPQRWEPRERIRLVIGDADGPSLRRVARFQACAPVMLDREQLARAVQVQAGELQITRQHRVVLFVFVERDGSARESRIDQSSGDFRIDMAAQTVLATASFTPAAIEGIRVPVWVQFPVTFAPPGRGPGR